MKKIIIITAIIGISVLGVILFRIIQPYFEFTINDNKDEIALEIRRLVNRDCTILMMRDIDNKKVVLFSMGLTIGESEFTRGPNYKLRIESTGHGSNMVRYRIMTTNQGQYIRFLGKNDDRIGRILAFVDGEKYNIPVIGGDYLIETAIINKPTKSDFPSGSVWYDRTNKELYRIGISKDQIIE